MKALAELYLEKHCKAIRRQAVQVVAEMFDASFSLVVYMKRNVLPNPKPNVQNISAFEMATADWPTFWPATTR